jgi:hypothetical protein
VNGILNDNQISYVFYHLSFFIEIEHYTIFFSFSDKKNLKKNHIKFNLSLSDLKLENILYVDDIPILFPLSRKKIFFRQEEKNIIFEHDLLKSAFYLLSGYQEYKGGIRTDKYGRFEYRDSIQKKLGIVKKPIVNYYFEIIIAGIEQFCRLNNIEFCRKKIYKKPVFVLSHDIDNIKKSYFRYALFYIREMLKGKKKVDVKKIISYFFISYKKMWSFKTLQKIEQKRHIKSVYYFLPAGEFDSDYSLSSKRIIKIIKKLKSEGCEIGLHGVFDSYLDLEKLSTLKILSEKIFGFDKIGIRQHFLMCSLPQTFIYQKKAGFLYDSTLGYAEYEGFRNSFCFPFKLYDFENDVILDYWQIPLLAMDVSLFEYRRMNYEQILESFSEIMAEIKKFNGVFELLWHNTFFDEVAYPGIKVFYERLLDYFLEEGFDVKLNKELIEEFL